MKVLRIFVLSLQIKIYILSHPNLALATVDREMSNPRPRMILRNQNDHAESVIWLLAKRNRRKVLSKLHRI